MRYEVEIPIGRPYNPGEWRLSMQVTGPRGGKSWTPVASTPATGGRYVTALPPGRYKVTEWGNGWPHSFEFVIDDDGDTDLYD